MSRRRLAAALGAALLLGGCGGGAGGPAGWQQDPKSATSWQTGSGKGAQSYTLDRRDFTGTLQDLASAEATNVVLKRRGAKFDRSDVFGPCPGQAALVRFSLPNGRLLQEGLAVLNGRAVVAGYERPASAQDDPAALQALERALCTATL